MRNIGIGFSALAVVASVWLGACSAFDGGSDPSGKAPETSAAKETSSPAIQALTRPEDFGKIDTSELVVQRGAESQVAMPTLSRPLRELALEPAGANEEGEDEERDRAPRPNPNRVPFFDGPDLAAQKGAPIVTMPVAIKSFVGQGKTLGGCIFPRPDGGEPSTCTTTGVPPDTNGAVGPNHYVQTVNGGIGIWHKDGTLASQPMLLVNLWKGYTGTNAGNACGTNNDGDPVVLYDSLADRWFVTQFSLPNTNTNAGPSFQCVAVSQTGDPTGAYYLYDFKYAAAINDYGKFGVWEDSYLATFNNFGVQSSMGADLCAYDRASMLQGKPAQQHCFQQSGNVFGVLPASIDGPIKPPNGAPGYFVTLKPSSAISLYKMHLDWVTPANSTLTGPTNITVAAYTELCGGSSCVPEPSPGNALASLADRPMFHLSYRNYGSYESLVFNHSISSNAAGAPRWYEIRSPGATPTLFQQGTFAPGDGNNRWMGSINQDQAGNMALGYSVSSSTMQPSIAWTGRLVKDTAGTMAQGETIIVNGAGVEIGSSQGTTYDRWGDYSNMTVDPADDCTFWFTTELYPANGAGGWDTHISSVKFPTCAANDFKIAIQPATQTVAVGGSVNYTVSTTSTVGTPEPIVLTVQDLPTGVTGSFTPATITAGQTSTLKLTAAANAPNAGATFMVIGKADSAVHAATAAVVVGSCTPKTTCGAGQNCGTIDNGCGGTVSCGSCGANQTCVGNQCVVSTPDAGAVDASAPDASTPDASGGVDAGSDDASTGFDSSAPDSSAGDSGFVAPDASNSGNDAASAGDGSTDDGGSSSDATSSDNSGCGCRVVESKSASPWGLAGVSGVAFIAALRRRRRAEKRERA